MTSIQNMRNYVSGMYLGKRWSQKVSRMSDDRVIAIYMKEINKKPLPKQPKE